MARIRNTEKAVQTLAGTIATQAYIVISVLKPREITW